MSTFGDTASRWAARLAMAAPRRLWEGEPHVRARRIGLDFSLDLRDNVQRILYFTGYYERRYTRFLKKYLNKGDIYVDVGAHIGIHAMVMAKALANLGGGEVFAFEATEDSAMLLREAARQNGLTNLAVETLALSSVTGEIPIYGDPEKFHSNDAAVRSFYGTGAPLALVQATTFDAWARARGAGVMDVVKIDVEGAEFAVLEGMRDSMAKHPPRIVGIEIRDYLLRRAGVDERQLRSILAEFGYEGRPRGNLDGNFIFERKDS